MGSTKDRAVDSVSVDTDPDHRVCVSFYRDITTGQREEFTMEMGDALTFLRDLAAQLSYAAAGVARELYIGDCETCRNGSRLVDVEPSGANRWSTKDRCPDCGPRYHNAGVFPPYPRVGGGVR